MILGASLDRVSDLMALIKPRITLLVLITTASGLWLADRKLENSFIFFTFLGTLLLVGSANALNMYLERETDALMRRTKNRPLPARRMNPKIALWFGIGSGIISLLILTFFVNHLTALLGAIAFMSYVLFYTPLKKKSHVALLIGAIPGAIPPLMGWTAATQSIDIPGLVLFFILFLWQIPHFLAIALYRREEYEKAGIKILPMEKGEKETKQWIVRYLAGLVAVSFYPIFFGMSGMLYFWTAFFLGGLFFFWGVYGLQSKAGIKWAKSFFFLSILYLPLILLALVLSRRG